MKARAVASAQEKWVATALGETQWAAMQCAFNQLREHAGETVMTDVRIAVLPMEDADMPHLKWIGVMSYTADGTTH
jgi:hypothetical protein